MAGLRHSVPQIQIHIEQGVIQNVWSTVACDVTVVDVDHDAEERVSESVWMMTCADTPGELDDAVAALRDQSRNGETT